MRVIKRDGSQVAYDLEKISIAISGAFEELNGEFSDAVVLNEIEARIFDGITVEEIQDIVEDALINCGYVDEAKAYIKYRWEHERLRNERQQAALRSKLFADSVENQNANVDEHSFGGRMGEANSVVLKEYALYNCMSKKSRENHQNMEIYIHDLDHYAVGDHNCLSIPFDDLLANGFNTRQTDVRPANSVNTAMQLVAVIFQLQSLQQFGGVAATHLDWTMVPYVRKSFYKHFKNGLKYIDNTNEYTSPRFNDTLAIDAIQYTSHNGKAYQYAMDMTVKEVYQAVEGMYHNLNTLQSRSGNQLPFTSINYGTCTLPEGRMVTKALLEVSIYGLGALRKTSIFPCGIFQCMKGVNREPGDPNYDLYRLALRSTAQRLYPNYVNVDWSVNEGYDRDNPATYTATMGCRTYNGYDINGFGQLKDGRGNICPVTIILPMLAMRANGNVEEFMKLLDKKIHEAKDMLIERFEWICSQSPASAKFMYENNVMAGYVPEEGIRSALKHGTLALGQLGMAETLQILIGCDHTQSEGMELAKRIEQLFSDRCNEFKQEYKLNFGVYYTPAENLCHKAMKFFQEKYGTIPNVSDREYFTNSIHVPVWHEVSPFEKIDIESELTGYSRAGCITYVELDAGAINNIDALETLVNYAMDKDIPYFAINVPNDTCLECGYTAEFNDSCPVCGSEDIQQLRRVTGYLTGNYSTAFNKGKQAEVNDRVKHSKHMANWSNNEV